LQHFVMRLNWGAVLAFNESALGTVALKATPRGIVPKGEWTDHEDRPAAVSVEVARKTVQTAARDHAFHPVKAYLRGLKRDGVQRVEATESGTARVWNGDIEEAMPSLFPVFLSIETKCVHAQNCRLWIFSPRLGTRENMEGILHTLTRKL
jgi:hypothetical protein